MCSVTSTVCSVTGTVCSVTGTVRSATDTMRSATGTVRSATSTVRSGTGTITCVHVKKQLESGKDSWLLGKTVVVKAGAYIVSIDRKTIVYWKLLKLCFLKRKKLSCP